MEKFSDCFRTRHQFIALLAAGLLVSSCSIDSYLTDPAAVKCDEKRTKIDLPANSLAAFIVHGKTKGEVATIDVRRNEAGVSVAVTGDVTGPPQQLEADGFTKPIPLANSTEVSAFGAGGAWVITFQKNTVVIEGTCDDM